MKPAKEQQQSFTLSLETLSPVSIGNGEILSPYTDFVFDNRQNEVHIIDKEKVTNSIVEKDLAEGTNYMQQFIDGIYGSFNNNRAEFDLKRFIEKQAAIGLDTAEYAQRTIPYNGLSKNDRREVKCVVKDNDHPYVPGSSIKGAIKGAMLYDWLTNETAGKSALNHLMQRTLATFQLCRPEMESIAFLAGKRYVAYEDKQKIKRLKKDVGRKGGKQLSKEFNEVFASLLTKDTKPLPRDFSLLKVSDSNLLTASDLRLQLTKRLHYVKGQVTIPVNLETIRKGATGTFKIAINPKFQHDDLQFLNKEEPLKNLLEIINTFHKDNVDLEMEIIDNTPWYDKARGNDKAIFENYSTFLEELYDKMNNVAANEAYMCLGFGKSFFYNSIGILIKDWANQQENLSEEDQLVFRKYCQLFFLGKDGQKSFPLTRTVTSRGMGMGWMKIVIS